MLDPVILAIATTPTQWDLAHGGLLPGNPADGRAEFAAVEVHAPAGTLRLEGPGATLDRDPAADGAGAITVARRLVVPYSTFEHGKEEGDTYEVPPEAAAALLGLLAGYAWHLVEAPDALEAAWAEGAPITAAMLETPPPAKPTPVPPVIPTPAPSPPKPEPAPAPSEVPPAEPAKTGPEATKP